MKRARIDHLHTEAQRRRPGYLEACLKAGRISRDGQWLTFTDEQHAQLRKQFNPNPFPAAKVYQRTPRQSLTRAAIRRFISIPFVNQAAYRVGLGDLIHKIAGPIGRALHWPCLKGDGTIDLKPNSGCAKARDLANKVKI